MAHSSEKAMAPHSSTLAWKIPWTEEPVGLQSMGSLRVRHNWATSLSLFTFMHWRRKWQPTPLFLAGESQGQGAWWAAVYGVAQSWTRLKQLSMWPYWYVSFRKRDDPWGWCSRWISQYLNDSMSAPVNLIKIEPSPIPMEENMVQIFYLD